MTPLFKRDYVLYIRKSKNNTTDEVLEIRELRCSFKVKKTVELEPNTAEIKIYNLSEDTRNKLKKKGGYMHFEAGYEGQLNQVFQGFIREIDHTREGTEWCTTFHSSDGLVPLQDTKCYQAYPPKTKKKDCALDVASLMKNDGMSFDPGDFDDIEGEFPNGLSTTGTAAKTMKKILEGADRVWSIQDGKFQIRKRGEPAKGSTLLISPQSGLVGSPSHVAAETSNNTAKGLEQKVPPPNKPAEARPVNRKAIAHVKAKFLLNGSVRCGTKIAIQSENISGVYMVDLIEHSGDNWGNDWYTEIEGVSVSEGIA